MVDALNATASALVRPHTGVFTRFDDDDLTQTPLKVSRVELALPDGTVRAVTAADIHHLAGARTRALHRAAVLYVDHTVPAPPAGRNTAHPSHRPPRHLRRDRRHPGHRLDPRALAAYR